MDDLVLAWSRDTMESDELDRARATLRSMVVRLGEAAENGLGDPRQRVAPFVEALLAARRQAREERRWADADALRDRLLAAGIEVRDAPEGTSWELR
jgi:cysteinyl-tRNA synthetase